MEMPRGLGVVQDCLLDGGQSHMAEVLTKQKQQEELSYCFGGGPLPMWAREVPKIQTSCLPASC